jgi:hypothetical protein
MNWGEGGAHIKIVKHYTVEISKIRRIIFGDKAFS